jgi:hypothetical protein
MVIPARHNNSKDILRDRCFILRCDWHKTKGVHQLVCIFSKFRLSNCTDCSVLDLHLFRYKSTTFQYLPYCTACSHNFLPTAYSHHHGTRLIFISLNILCRTQYFKRKPQSSRISMACMKNNFLYNMPLSREVWLNIVYIILIWYKAELISPAHYHVHFQYQVKSKLEFLLCMPLCH